MTVASGGLLILEPGSKGEARRVIVEPIALAVTDRQPTAADSLFDTKPRVDATAWTAIHVHFSGRSRDSATTVHLRHQAFGGLAHHFVIGNGGLTRDGLIEVGPRWRRQMPSYDMIVDPSVDDGQAPLASGVINICLVGDFDRSRPTGAQQGELLWLVRELQTRLSIPASRIHVDSEHSRLFPHALFRQQLLRF